MPLVRILVDDLNIPSKPRRGDLLRIDDNLAKAWGRRGIATVTDEQLEYENRLANHDPMYDDPDPDEEDDECDTSA